jgi:hypothetical protein
MQNAARWVWALEVEWAGRTRRVAEVDLEMTTDAGEVASFDGGLEPVGFEESLNLLEVEPAATEVGVSFDFGPALPSFLAAGHDLRTGYGVLRLVPVDIAGAPLVTLDRATIIALGPLLSPAYGDPERPTVIQATLGQVESPTEAPLIPPSSVISEDRFPLAEPSHKGKTFPFVFGRPGYIQSGGNFIQRPGSPIYYLTEAGSSVTVPPAGLIAGHPVKATTVDVYVVETDTWESGVGVIQGDDLLRGYREFLAARAEGRSAEGTLSVAAIYLLTLFDARTDWQDDFSFVSGLSLIDLTTMTAPPVGAQQAWARWTEPALVGFDGQAVETAGDLVLTLLRASGVTFDLGRTRAVCEALTHPVSGYLNDGEVTAWDYLQEVVLPLLPVTLCGGPGGIYPVLLTPEALEGAGAFFVWTEGEEVEAVSAAQAEASDAPVAVRVRFGFDGLKETYVGQAAAGPTGSGSLERSSSGWSKALASRGLGRGIVDLEATIITDAATAHRIAVEQLAVRSWPIVHRTYAAPAGTVLQLGDVGRITDAAVGWTSEPAMVMGREWDGARWLYRLALRLRPRL